ncbi:MAG: hypothetical protein ACOY71_14140 [Gemmatimonadota bacterium]
MIRLMGFVGGMVGSAVGWWAGRHAGVMTAFILSMVGTGIGLYLGRRWAADYEGRVPW